MDASKLKGQTAHDEEEESRLTYDAEEYEDEDKREEEEEKEVEEQQQQWQHEQQQQQERNSTVTDNGLTKRQRSPVEASASNTGTGDGPIDEDYFEDPASDQYDNTYYYYDEYENGNRSRYEAVGKVSVISHRTVIIHLISPKLLALLRVTTRSIFLFF